MLYPPDSPVKRRQSISAGSGHGAAAAAAAATGNAQYYSSSGAAAAFSPSKSLQQQQQQQTSSCDSNNWNSNSNSSPVKKRQSPRQSSGGDNYHGHYHTATLHPYHGNHDDTGGAVADDVVIHSSPSKRLDNSPAKKRYISHQASSPAKMRPNSMLAAAARAGNANTATATSKSGIGGLPFTPLLSDSSLHYHGPAMPPQHYSPAPKRRPVVASPYTQQQHQPQSLFLWVKKFLARNGLRSRRTVLSALLVLLGLALTTVTPYVLLHSSSSDRGLTAKTAAAYYENNGAPPLSLPVVPVVQRKSLKVSKPESDATARASQLHSQQRQTAVEGAAISPPNQKQQHNPIAAATATAAATNTTTTTVDRSALVHAFENRKRQKLLDAAAAERQKELEQQQGAHHHVRRRGSDGSSSSSSGGKENGVGDTITTAAATISVEKKEHDPTATAAAAANEPKQIVAVEEKEEVVVAAATVAAAKAAAAATANHPKPELAVEEKEEIVVAAAAKEVLGAKHKKGDKGDEAQPPPVVAGGDDVAKKLKEVPQSDVVAKVKTNKEEPEPAKKSPVKGIAAAAKEVLGVKHRKGDIAGEAQPPYVVAVGDDVAKKMKEVPQSDVVAKVKTNKEEPESANESLVKEIERDAVAEKMKSADRRVVSADHKMAKNADRPLQVKPKQIMAGTVVEFHSDGTVKEPPPPPVTKIQIVSRRNQKRVDPQPPTPTHSQFAYMYIVGGCDPDNPAYLPFLYNIVLSTYLQRQEGSKEDVVVFAQMSYASAHEALPASDLRVLSELGIAVRYIPKNQAESFDQLMQIDRFRMLNLTEYERVIYMDADVMVRGSLDYLFNLSVDGTLKQNLIFSGRKIPAIGAIFMLAPVDGDYDWIQAILAEREKGGAWDIEKGWGHAFEEDDVYELVGGRKRRGWEFPGASADVGLLYNWVKYEKKTGFSIVMRDTIKNWGFGDDGKLTLESTLKLSDDSIFNSDLSVPHECWKGTMDHKPCKAPHSDYIHFAGLSKPWLSKPPSTDASSDDSPAKFWFHMLSIVNDKFQMKIDIQNWDPKRRPLLGLHPNNLDTVTAVAATSSNGKHPPTVTSRFAYAYVVGGCDPDNPAYKFFIQNILVNTFLQRDDGSKSDVVVFVQMLYKSKYDSLPDSDMRLLNAMKIKVHYIPKAEDESFDKIVMEKFRVLGLTQYERVLFMDSDVMVRGSLDYLFDLSINGVLKRNIVFADQQTPAIGGIFVVAPMEGYWDLVLDIIRAKEDRGASLPYPHWDLDKGWGHAFEGDDNYEVIGGEQYKAWDFHGAHSDSGLLYSWVKYEEKSVSIVMRNTIQNWGVDALGKVHLEKTLHLDVFDGLARKHDCWHDMLDHKPCVTPHSDFVHFRAAKKPWLHKPPEHFSAGFASHSPLHFWFHTLSVLNEQLGMGIDFANWKVNHRPLLGMHANNIDAVVVAPETPAGTQGDTSQFAYAYVVGGCDPSDPAYRNFIYNILANTYLQQEDGSKADVVVLVQMAFDSAYNSLPDIDTRVLNEMHIRIVYIPKTEDESFERLMIDKFRILGLTHYKRVLFMDSDVMARGSLDYLFQLSMQGVLKENVVLSGNDEPAIGSFFMVAPKHGDWDRVLEVIRGKEERGANLPFPHWDEEKGWGHAFEGTDGYEILNGKKKSKWDFHGAESDQGLLYHWVKYEKKSASIVTHSSIHNWGDNVTLEETLAIELFSPHSVQRECWNDTLSRKPCLAPHNDFIHFPGATKPWLSGPPPDWSDSTASSSPQHFWFKTMKVLNDKLSLGLNFKDWKKDHRPLLGLFPGDNGMAGTTYTDFSSKEIVSPFTNTVTSPNRFAYAYVIGGCKPEDPSYRNYFNDIMINTYVQREEGSMSDVVVFVQMAFESAQDTLPDQDLRLLSAMGIKIKYIPKAEDESFYRIMLDKFLILGLTQYERVLFMDGDVMARGNLDYIFELSVQGVLKKNLVIAGQTEPANGGFFMLAPGEGSADRAMAIIRDKEERGVNMPYPHWNETVGWGHAFEEDDYYELLNTKKHSIWDFYGAFADQGLLYHWVKYEEKSVSIVFRHSVQNWDVDASGTVHLEETLGIDIFKNVTVKRECWREVMKHKPCKAPHSDFVHFTGKSKPWLHPPPEGFDELSDASPQHFWFHILHILNDKMHIGLDFSKWKTHHRPFLGMFPKHADAAKTAYASTNEK